MVEIILAFFMGIGVAAGGYEFLAEMREKQIKKLASKTLACVVEESTMRISERSKILGRDLTEDEKDKIVDEYYNECKLIKARVI